MGGSASTSRDKSHNQKKAVRSVNENIKSIEAKQTQICTEFKNGNIDQDLLFQTIKLSEIAKTQVMRNDKPFNKADLQVILMHLDRNNAMKWLNASSNYTTLELHQEIRSIIYSEGARKRLESTQSAQNSGYPQIEHSGKPQIGKAKTPQIEYGGKARYSKAERHRLNKDQQENQQENQLQLK